MNLYLSGWPGGGGVRQLYFSFQESLSSPLRHPEMGQMEAISRRAPGSLRQTGKAAATVASLYGTFVPLLKQPAFVACLVQQNPKF